MDLKLEVYTPALELVGMLEIQRSVIWAEKAFSAGSFSLESLITEETRALLVPENILWIEGDTGGIIEHVEQQAGADGPYITVKGRDLTGILDRRILWGQYDLHGTPAAIMHQLVNDCAINPTRGDTEARKLPGLVSLAVPVGGEAIRAQKTGGTLLDALEQLGETYQVAFGVRFNAAVPRMEFWTRPGADRSVNQSANEPVFYSTELDDVLESVYSYDSSKYRNAALVAGEGEGGQRVMVTVENAVEPEPKPPEPPEPGKTYTITLAVDPEGGGVASGGGTVNEGDSVTVTASPSSGYVFVGWQENGVIVSTDAAYTFQVNSDHNLTAVFAYMSTKEYNYTGDVVTTTLYPGVYKLEAWGAEGGYRTDPNYAGKGGYSIGNITITQATVIFIRVGGAGNTGGTSGGFNGGGKRGTYNGGGGASDIRISADDFNHRVIVAGGGGSDGASNKAGGYGGGTAGQNRTDNYGTGGYGGTQTGVSDSSWQADAPSTNTTEQSGAYAGFGFGGNGISSGSGHGGAGGGGWYGGSGSVPDSSGDDDRGGGGGSGFVWTGENVPAGFGLTDAHYLTNARTVDGAQSFASPAGTTETGHSGNGYVRITPVAFYVVTVVSEDAAKGTVSGGGRYENGTQVTVSASPTSGYKLSGWYENGEQVSADKNYTFTVSGNRTLTARFEQASTYTITLSIDPAQADWGTVSGGGQYQEGTQVTVTAAPAEGYQFVAWQADGQQVSTSKSYSFTVSGDVALVAVFEEEKKITFVEYIDTHQYNNAVNTGCRAKFLSTRIVLDIMILGEHPASGKEYSIIAVSGSMNLSRTGNTQYSYWSVSSSNKKSISKSITGTRTTIEWDLPGGKLKIGTSSYTTTTASGTPSNPLYILGLANFGPQMRVWGVKVYEGSTLIRDFSPCIDPSGEAGLYDLVEGKFYGNNGSGKFTAGPAV